jgi:hypothetical protein
MLFSSLAFAVTTIVAFSILSLYYRLYISSWYDPLGDIFWRIMQEEKDEASRAEKKLFQ